MVTDTYDLIVIGAGMAGLAAANKCASQGWRVAIVDELPYGGTCALRGCDPKKILRRGAEIIDSARLMRGKGIDDSGLSINWADLMNPQARLHRSGTREHGREPVGQRCRDAPRHGHVQQREPARHRRSALRVEAFPDRHRGSPAAHGLPRPRAPHRQHRFPQP
jgi:glycine/D-amino acid oxidase-like deaminating enzyme